MSIWNTERRMTADGPAPIDQTTSVGAPGTSASEDAEGSAFVLPDRAEIDARFSASQEDEDAIPSAFAQVLTGRPSPFQLPPAWTPETTPFTVGTPTPIEACEASPFEPTGSGLVLRDGLDRYSLSLPELISTLRSFEAAFERLNFRVDPQREIIRSDMQSFLALMSRWLDGSEEQSENTRSAIERSVLELVDAFDSLRLGTGPVSGAAGERLAASLRAALTAVSRLLPPPPPSSATLVSPAAANLSTSARTSATPMADTLRAALDRISPNGVPPTDGEMSAAVTAALATAVQRLSRLERQARLGEAETQLAGGLIQEIEVALSSADTRGYGGALEAASDLLTLLSVDSLRGEQF